MKRPFCHTVGMTREWLLTDNITPAETIVEMMFASMPENLRSIFFNDFLFDRARETCPCPFDLIFLIHNENILLQKY